MEHNPLDTQTKPLETQTQKSRHGPQSHSTQEPQEGLVWNINHSTTADIIIHWTLKPRNLFCARLAHSLSAQREVPWPGGKALPLGN